MKPRILAAVACCFLLVVPQLGAQPVTFELKADDRVIFLGDRMAEAEGEIGWIETMLTSRFADRSVSFRNLGWSGDTPAGESRLGLSLLQAGREPADEGWRQLTQQAANAKPTVAFIAYGMASSFDGAVGLEKFKADYAKLLDAIAASSPGVRFVLLGPIRHEALGRPWPDPAAHNQQLDAYDAAIAALASARRLPYVSFFGAMRARDIAGPNSDKLTQNGVLLNAAGYRYAAQVVEDQLLAGPSGAWRTSPQTEALRQAILRKNEAFFHRSRPANMAYIFGFRRAEQGRNAGEVAQFDAEIAAEEKRIAALRGLQPARVPEVPQRVGNLAAQHTEQPHPQFEVADGFEVTLWAENPLLHKPIQMNFDGRGRLWVASSEVYPQIEPGQAQTDKIVVLEDTTGGGKADKATVFADGLLIPTGVVPGDNGCYVAQSTELLHFADTDGDGKADVRRVVLSGFGTEDTHHNLHTLHWGPDGRLYMNQSVYTRTNAETPHGVMRLKAGGTFRFDPRDQQMEILFRGWVNAWGHQFDDYGQSFVTDGAGFQGLSWAIPGATYFTLAPARRQLQSISPGNYPKFAGLEIVRSALFPADWQGDMITCDFRAHRVVRFKASDQDAGYITKQMPDLLRTTVDSFRPIDVKLGPDGALYVADWSNPIIQHGEVDFRDPRRDKEHGRIWRIAPKGRAPLPRMDLTRLGVEALIDKLVSPNGYEQERAERELVERGAARVIPELDAWANRQTSKFALLRALWLYQAFNQADRPVLFRKLIGDADPRIRAAAVRALPDNTVIDALAQLVADPHPRVRVEAVRALGKTGSAEGAATALAVLDRPMDPFLDYALWLTINELVDPWIAAVKSGAWIPDGREKQLEFALKAIEPARASEVLDQLIGGKPLPRDGAGPWLELIGVAGGASELRLLFDQTVRGEFVPSAQVRALAALADAARVRNVKPEGEVSGLEPLLTARDEATRVAAAQLAGAWKRPRFTPTLLRLAANVGASAAERAAVFGALRDTGGAEVTSGLKKLAAGGAPEVRREAILALAALDLNAAVPEAMALLKATTSEADATNLWRALLGIRGAGARLATAVADANLPKEVARAGLRPAREGTQNQALVQALMKSAGLALTSVQLSAAEMSALAQEAIAKGDAARGERLYRRAELACTVCHAIGGAGGKVGPDLASIGASAPADYIVESLIYPSAKIKEGYHSVVIAKKNGQQFAGMIVKEDAGEIVLRDASNAEVKIAVADVATRTSVGSLMPAGLVDTLLPEERLDLVKFLSLLGKPGDYDAPKGGVARTWKLYLVTARNEPYGTERVVQGDFTLRDWQPTLSLVNGALPREAIDTAFPSLSNNRGLFAAARFESPQGGPVTFELTGEAVGLWVNGQQAKFGPKMTIEAKPGANIVVVQLDDKIFANAKLTSPDVTFVGF